MNLDYLLSVAHSPIYNYVVPGITSWLITNPSPNGCVRLLHSSRDQYSYVTPHSHRFNFTAIVLKGEMENILFQLSLETNSDSYYSSTLFYGGKPGEYEKSSHNVEDYSTISTTYKELESYEMQSNQIHSVYFARDTYVLITEGPQVTKATTILEPVVNGKVIPLFKIEPWMYKE
jgi:hypothetical protein